MVNNLRAYIDSLFADAPATRKTVEVKEEILQNLIDKYNDLIMEGKSEEAAYNISVASIGDISELIAELKGGVSTMPTNPDFEMEKKRSALLTAIAVTLYILCVIPVLLFQGTVGIVTMFVMIAGATALLVYKNMTKPTYNKMDETIAEEFMVWREQSSAKKQTYRAIHSALWSVMVAIYILVSFWTHAWHITWIIFLIAGAIGNILKAVFDMRQ